tara:strand:+ start:566 stop:898 length:333 start_codon:yes stop_codon:yes gene_type:complete
MGIGAGTAALISAAVGAATAGTSMVLQKKAADEAEGRRQDDKAAAESAMISQKREDAMTDAAAERDEFDAAALLEAEQDPAGTMNRTRLSGAGGVDPEQMRLGTAALLGE